MHINWFLVDIQIAKSFYLFNRILWKNLFQSIYYDIFSFLKIHWCIYHLSYEFFFFGEFGVDYAFFGDLDLVNDVDDLTLWKRLGLPVGDFCRCGDLTGIDSFAYVAWSTVMP